jgi:hypothetical protein
MTRHCPACHGPLIALNDVQAAFCLLPSRHLESRLGTGALDAARCPACRLVCLTPRRPPPPEHCPSCGAASVVFVSAELRAPSHFDAGRETIRFACRARGCGHHDVLDEELPPTPPLPADAPGCFGARATRGYGLGVDF